MIKETTNIRGQIIVFIGFNVTVRAKCDSGNTPYTYNISPTMPYIYIVKQKQKPLLEANTDIFIIISSGVGFLLFRVAKQHAACFCTFHCVCFLGCVHTTVSIITRGTDTTNENHSNVAKAAVAEAEAEPPAPAIH